MVGGVCATVVDDENDGDVEKRMRVMILMHAWYAPVRVVIVIYGLMREGCYLWVDERGLL